MRARPWLDLLLAGVLVFAGEVLRLALALTDSPSFFGFAALAPFLNDLITPIFSLFLARCDESLPLLFEGIDTV
jgi:hypothetical protein